MGLPRSLPDTSAYGVEIIGADSERIAGQLTDHRFAPIYIPRSE